MAANGVDPNQPQNVLDVPEPAVLVKVLDTWEQQRKAAQVLLVMDVSGSMADPAAEGSDVTKLELARDAAIAALDQFKDEDSVGLRIFTTDIGDQAGATSLDLVPVAPMDEGQRARLRDQIEGLFPQNGTPLYQATQEAAETIRDTYDPTLINAVVLLTDGVNDDGDQGDDANQLDELIRTLRGGEGANAKAGAGLPDRATARTPTRPPCVASPRRPTARSTWPATRPPSTTSSPPSSRTSRALRVAPSARDQPIVSIG